MEQFWRYGYANTSVDDLVRTTGSSRHAIYTELGGKAQLFEQCLALYSALIVTPAFACVESEGATLSDIAQYFEHQISLAERSGLPGVGCLMANTTSEVASHDGKTIALVAKHNARLKQGFAGALLNELSNKDWTKKARIEVGKCSVALVVFANGLWSASRMTDSASELRNSVGVMLDGIENSFKSIAA